MKQVHKAMMFCGMVVMMASFRPELQENGLSILVFVIGLGWLVSAALTGLDQASRKHETPGK